MKPNPFIQWLLTSSFFWRKVTSTVAAGLTAIGLQNNSNSAAITGAVVFLLEVIVSKYCNVQLKQLAEAPAAAPWVPVQPAEPVQRSSQPPAGLGPMHRP